MMLLTACASSLAALRSFRFSRDSLPLRSSFSCAAVSSPAVCSRRSSIWLIPERRADSSALPSAAADSSSASSARRDSAVRAAPAAVSVSSRAFASRPSSSCASAALS